MKKGNALLLLAVIPFGTFVVLFLLVPVISMIWGSFQTDGGGAFTIAQYKEVLSNPYYFQAFQNSVLISFLSSAIGIIAAVFAAYAITRTPKHVRERLLAFAFIVLLGNSGVFTLLCKQLGIDLGSFQLYSWTGLTLIYVYFQLPLAVMLLYPIYYGIQEQWKEAAELLGATSTIFWLRIGLPVLLPGIAGTFSILFANAMGAYASAYALTGSTYNLVPIRIGALVSGDIFARPELGSALAVLLGMTLVAALLLNEWLTRKIRRNLS
jgi:putative spermidine/putrescine transport system permease protein